MYGLVVENLSEYVRSNWGEDKWEEIRNLARIDQSTFSTHQVYSETIVPKLAKKAAHVLNMSEQDLLFGMGQYFLTFVGQYGYDRMLSVLGRHVRDFINGLDNLHEYLKFSYPRMRPPSFFCESESSTGMTLHYRSKRKGYAHYTMGQIKEVANHFYGTEIKIDLLREEVQFDTCHVVFQVEFDNKAFTLEENLTLARDEVSLPLKGNILFEIFPFCVLFSTNMTVKHIGNSLMQILPNLVGKKLNEWFDLVRPLIDFKFQTILRRTNNIFEMQSSSEAKLTLDGDERRNSVIRKILQAEGTEDEEEEMAEHKIVLKGQMIFMEEWKMILFLCTPVMPDLDSMIFTGLYINDLSMHDFSRDLILAGTQQSVELKLALDQEQLKSKKLEESMRLLDEEMKRTDELLYQMIPKQVADRLRKGENPVDTCETFESVTILFSDVVTFTEICSRISPMEVVALLNAMYSIFDHLTEKHNVYKVETIGDAYMVVAGAPERRDGHGLMICNMGLDMVEAITDLKDPSTGNPLNIRVGIHTGMVVAGVVGVKMPRYCLFGDTVNTASRMESTSEAQKVHVSQTTADILSSDYEVAERGEITVKGKGIMKTYWLSDYKGRVSCKGEYEIPDMREAAANMVRRSSTASLGRIISSAGEKQRAKSARKRAEAAKSPQPPKPEEPKKEPPKVEVTPPPPAKAPEAKPPPPKAADPPTPAPKAPEPPTPAPKAPEPASPAPKAPEPAPKAPVTQTSPAAPLVPAAPPPPQMDNYVNPSMQNNEMSVATQNPFNYPIYPGNGFPQTIVFTSDLLQKAPSSIYNAMAEKLVFADQQKGADGESQYRHNIVHSHTCAII